MGVTSHKAYKSLENDDTGVKIQMVELSLEQKIADFHKARAQVRAPVERPAWKTHRFEMDMKYPQTYMPKEEAIELYERVLTILKHAPSKVSEVESLLATGDYEQATAKLAWIENNTFAGSNGSMIRRKDAHTKFAPHWANGKLVRRNPIVYMRSVEDMYAALSQIATEGATPLQYQLTRATAPFSPIFNEAAQVLHGSKTLAPVFYENNFGESSHAYRAGIFNQLTEMATTPMVSFVPRPFAGAFSLVERLREQFGNDEALAQVDALAPFLLYGIEKPQRTTTANDEGNVTRRYVHDGRRTNTPVANSPAPKYTPQKMTVVTDRPTVQIAYSPIFGGRVL